MPQPPRHKSLQIGIPWLLGGIFFIVLGACAVARVYRGGVAVSDLAIFHTAFLNTFKGQFYLSSLHPHGCLLYQHFDPIAFILLPFYALFGNAAWPVLPLSMAASGALLIPAVARLGRIEGLSPQAALLVPGLLLLNPTLHNMVWYDFHPLIFAMPLLAWGWVFNLERRWKTAAVCWLLAMLCKENIPLTVAGLGLALCLKRHWRVGTIWIGVGALAFVVINAWVIPAFGSSEDGSVYLSRYGWLGDSPLEILKTLALRPLFVMQTVFGRGSTWEWLAKMLLPFALLPLLAPEIALAALPEFAVLMLSDFTPMHSIKFHYPAPVLAVLSIAAVSGWARCIRLSIAVESRVGIAKSGHAIRWAVGIAAFLASSWILYTDGRSLPFLRQPVERDYYAREKRMRQIADLAERIPQSASVSLPAHLLNPRYAFMEYPLVAFAPDRMNIADFVVIDTHRRFWGGYMDAGLDEALAQFQADRRYKLVFHEKDLWAFKRKKALDQDEEARRERWRRLAPKG